MNNINLRAKQTSKDKVAIIKKDMEINDLLSVYPEEAYEKLLANKGKLVKISQMFSNTLNTISKSVLIMKCNTKTCPFKTVCVLNSNELAPEGYMCPIEKKIANEIELELSQRLNIDVQDTIEMELLYDFIDAKLLDMRTSGMLSEGSLIQTIKAISENKVHDLSKDISPEFKIKIELKKLKAGIFEEFMATRKAKKKYGIVSKEGDIARMLREGMIKDKE